MIRESLRGLFFGVCFEGGFGRYRCFDFCVKFLIFDKVEQWTDVYLGVVGDSRTGSFSKYTDPILV